MEFSPSGRYLVIIQKPSVTNNLKIIDLQGDKTENDNETNTTTTAIKQYNVVMAFHSTQHPTFLWPQIRFSNDEKFVFRILKGELAVYQLGITEKYGSITCIINFDIADIKTEQLTETAIISGRVITDEKSKRKKSLVSLYKLSDLNGKPIKEMTVSVCDRMKIKTSPDCKNVLLQSISDDTSTSSYYGESTLYFMDLLYGKFNKISLAEGPIHDFEWLPNGEGFITTAGHHPAKTNYYNSAAKFQKEICVSKVNTIRISPDSRILCLAGFGNLNGDIEIYSLKDYKVIGKTKMYCGVTLGWSNDSKYLISAVLSPRVRVDNEYRVFTYNGEELVNEKFSGEVYECDWVNTGEKIVKGEFEIEVSKKYLEDLKKKKEMEKNKPKNTLSNSLNNQMGGLGLGIGGAGAPGKKSGIPGMGKKKK